jgi:hypothetical protein
MKAIRVAVSAAGIAAMVAVIASGLQILSSAGASNGLDLR